MGPAEDYLPNTLVHTDQSIWPNEEPGVCAHLFVFTNESPDYEQTIQFYTNGSIQGFGAALVGIVTAFMLF